MLSPISVYVQLLELVVRDDHQLHSPRMALFATNAHHGLSAELKDGYIRNRCLRSVFLCFSGLDASEKVD